MFRFVKHFIFLLFLLTSTYFLAKPAFADNKIISNAHLQYDVSSSGNTHVTANISLTNATEDFYVSSYALQLGFETLSNIHASDPDGPVTASVKQTDKGQEITLNFNDIVAGKGKTLPFTLSFDTPDIATHNGNIWEINIPGLTSQSNFQDFSVDISVPSAFGKPTFVKPEVNSSTLHFTKDQLGKSGIAITFGNSQTYSYTLQYHLENTSPFPLRKEIALPPTTNYQDVSLEALSPKPASVSLDTDGNWIAVYALSPSQKLTVSATGLITVSLSPRKEILSETNREIFLKRQPYWQTDNKQIKDLANKLKTPEAIYDYVVTHLTYDFNRVKDQQIRIGALGVLENPSSAVCLEFTDLFIALSRAAGIPAREIDGFAYTQNTISRPLSLSKDVLHAWPEYYDTSKGAWIMVDPTWGNTTGGVDYFHTLDFDHVAFVIKGADSSYPVPAGGYKFADNENEKDVSVIVTQEKITDQPTVSMQVTLPESIMSGLPIGAQVTLVNTGTILFPSQPLGISANHLNPRQQSLTTPAIPPYGLTTLTVHFSKTPFLTNMRDTITMTIGQKSIESSVSIVPITKQAVIIGGITLVLLTIIIWLIAKRPWRI